MLLLNNERVITNLARQAATCLVSCLSASAGVRSQIQQFVDRRPLPLKQVKTVHVLQGEYAIVDVAREIVPVCICSSEATTCCIVALNCRLSGRRGLMHYDQPRADPEQFLATLMHGMIEPDLYIVGGFTEASGCGTETANKLLSALDQIDLPVQVRLACIGQLNTTANGAPRCVSLALHQGDAEECASPCHSNLDKGPQATQRLARIWTRKAPHLENVYYTLKQTLTVTNIDVRLSRETLHSFAAQLKLSDLQLLQLLSTSPQHEAASFIPGDVIVAAFSAAVL